VFTAEKVFGLIVEIQNALGGLEESTDICCADCNNFVSKYIDTPFVSIFNPIIAQIPNFTKTNNKKSTPTYSGKVKYKGKEYAAYFKNGKVVSCPELSKKKKCDISKLDCEVVGYDFNIDSSVFVNGISKIAFNFALSKGISASDLKDGLVIVKEDNGLKKITFKYDVIPFVPLNPMDKYIELDTEMLLYHNIILFNQDKKLWCYIDLFNTFQYYVLLCDNWDEKKIISETYFQQIQKIDRIAPEMRRWRPKYGLIYADTYDVEPSPCREEMYKRVKNAIQKESLKKDMGKVLSCKLKSDYMLNYIREDISEEEKRRYGLSLLLFFDENDKLIENHFRRVTLGRQEFDIVSYPLAIKMMLKSGMLDIKKYIYLKFDRMNKSLTDNS